MLHFIFGVATIAEFGPSGGGVNPQRCKSNNLQFLKFYWLFIRVYRGKKLSLLKFSSNFYQFSYNDSKDIIRTHKCGYFEFLGKNVVFDQN